MFTRLKIIIGLLVLCCAQLASAERFYEHDDRNLGVEFTQWNGPLSVDQAIERSLTFQPSLGAVRYRVESALKLSQSLKYNWGPAVRAFADEGFVAGRNVSGANQTSNDVNRRYGLSLEQDLNFYRASLDRQLARSEYNVQLTNNGNERLNVALAVSLIYLECLRYRKLVEATKEHGETLDYFSKIAEKRLELGTINSIRVRRIEVSRQRNKSELAFLNGLLEDSLVLLANSLGLINVKADDLIEPSINFDQNLAIEDIFPIVLDNNLALNIARQRLKQERTRYKQRVQDSYPNLTLAVSKSYSDYFQRENESDSVVELNFSWLVWDGLQRRRVRQASVSDIGSAREVVRSQILSLRSDLEANYSELRNANIEREFAEQASKEAQELVSLQKIAFQESEQTTILEIVTSADARFTSYSRAINAKYQAQSLMYQIKALLNELCGDSVC